MDESTRAAQQYHDDLAGFGAYAAQAPHNRGGAKSRYVAAVFDAALLPLLRQETEPVRLLDFGCGVGIFTIKAKPLCERIVGTDIAGRLLALGRRLAAANGVDLPLVQADGANLPLRARAVNRVVAREVFCAISDAVVPAVLREVSRVLEPGGKFYLLDQVSESPAWQRRPTEPLFRKRGVDEIVDLFRSAGFILESSMAVRQPRFPWIYGIWFHLIPAAFIEPLARLEVAWNRRFCPIKATRRWQNVLFVFQKPGAPGDRATSVPPQ
jgi:SAM-dependent methyltransferase